MTDYDPFRRATQGPTPREGIFLWSFVKDVRTFTGSLRSVAASADGDNEK